MQNDYGFYDVKFTISFVDYPSMTPFELSYVVEIIPDCTLGEILQESGEPLHYEIFSYVGKTGTLDLSASFTHTYDGHYNDYCGAMVI